MQCYHVLGRSLSPRACGAQVEVLKLSWRCPWECWPAIPALRELHLTGRGPGGQFDFTTLDLESALACRSLDSIAIDSDNIFLRMRARPPTEHKVRVAQARAERCCGLHEHVTRDNFSHEAPFCGAGACEAKRCQAQFANMRLLDPSP